MVPNAARRRGDRRDVRAQHLPLQLQQLADRLRDGRGGMAKKGHKNAVSITWKYAAGDEMVRGFARPSRRRRQGREGTEPALPQRRVPGPADRDRGAKPDAVFPFAGGGAVKFVKDYAGAGLKKSIPLRRRLPHRRHARSAGADAEGVMTTLHYADRPAQYAARQRLPPRLRQDLQAAARRLRGAGLRRGADARHRPDRREGRRQQEGRDRRGDREGEDRQPARCVPAFPVAQPGAGHLPAPGQRQGEQGGGRGLQGARRPGRAEAAADATRAPSRHLPHPVPELAAVRLLLFSSPAG